MMKTYRYPVLISILVVLCWPLAADPIEVTVAIPAQPDIIAMPEPELLTWLKSPISGERRIAAREIGRRGLVQHLPAIEDLLNDPVYRVRAVASVTAHKLGHKDATPLLRKLLDDLDPWVASCVAQPLVASDSRAVKVARELLESQDASVRGQAFEALWSSPDQTVSYEALALALRDPFRSIRINATRALGEKHSLRALEMLAAHFPVAPNQGYGNERWEVARAISGSDIWASVPFLIDLVLDPDPKIAYIAVVKLRELNPIADANQVRKSPQGAEALAGIWSQWWTDEMLKHQPEGRITPQPQ